MTFQPSTFDSFKKRSGKVINDSIDIKACETGFERLTIETIMYWNSKNIKNHMIKKSKILERLNAIIQRGARTAPSLFKIEVIQDVIDKYNSHLKTGFSKLSVGNGNVFKFSIDEFFKFSKFQRERINYNSRLEILKNKRSLFFSLHSNENEFFYPKKQARPEFREMLFSIVGHFEQVLGYQFEISDDLKKYCQLSLQNCFDGHKGDIILCDGLVSKYEIENSETFYTPELFYIWIMRYIADKNNGFKVEYLNAKFFYSNFIKWMDSIGRKIS